MILIMFWESRNHDNKLNHFCYIFVIFPHPFIHFTSDLKLPSGILFSFNLFGYTLISQLYLMLRKVSLIDDFAVPINR